MKKLLLGLSILTCLTGYAQNWIQTGPNFTSSKASLAIGNNDTTYIAYEEYDGTDWRLSVKKYNGTDWVYVGDSMISTGDLDGTSFEISAAGVLYVAYTDEANNNLLVIKTFDGTNWVDVGNHGITAASYTPTITFDNNDVLHVAFDQNGTSFADPGGANLIKYDGTNWSMIGAAKFCEHSSRNLKLAFDAANDPHICYTNGAFLRSWKYDPDSTKWVTYADGFGQITGDQGIDIGFRNNVLYLFHVDGLNDKKGSVKRYINGAWVDLGSAGFTADEISGATMKIDDLGNVYVAYRDASDGNYMTVMKFNGVSWKTLGNAGDDNYVIPYGSRKCIALDSYGDLHRADGGNGTSQVSKFNCSNETYSDSISADNGVITSANTAAARYQWMNCSDTSLISGATSRSFTATETGSYFVVISHGSCTDTSACLAIDSLQTGIGVEENDFITLFPNPAIEILNIKSNQSVIGVSIFNALGEEVAYHTSSKVPVSSLEKGIYLIRIQTRNGIFNKRFTKM